MKNLVVIHLESLSNEIFNKMRPRLATTSRLMERSTVFNRFHSTATSSLMAVCDFMYGNSHEMDHVVDWDDPKNGPRGLECHFFDLLREAGYRTASVGFPPIWRDDINHWRLWGDSSEPFTWVDQHEEFRGGIDRALDVDDESPFALYVWDQRSHLSYSDEVKPESMKGFERIEIGYGCLDATVAHVWQKLEDAGLLDDTLILGFGDHGDQFFSHGSYFGFCHGYEPYTELIATPAFLYDAAAEPGHIEGLASLVDLKRTCLGRLDIPYDEGRSPASGIDLFKQRRDTVFAQNLFTSQQPNKALPKSFSVTDENFHLILSEHGLELHAHRLDPTNHNNLLSFFDMDERGAIVHNNREATHSHFRNTFNPPQIAEIEERFHFLRGKLAALLRWKLRQCESCVFDPTGFLRVRQRSFLWNTDHRSLAAPSPLQLRSFLHREPPFEEI